MVASHGASPSGRFTAVLGRSGSVDRLDGFCSGGAVDEVEGTRGLCVVEGFRVPAGVTFRVALAGLDGAVPALPPIFAFNGGVAMPVLVPDLTWPEDTGAPVYESPSSISFWLLMLLALAWVLGSSSSMLPLIVRFLGMGVSRSSLVDGIGMALEVRTGILEPLLRKFGVPPLLASRAISSAVRRSHPLFSKGSASSCTGDDILDRFPSCVEAQFSFCSVRAGSVTCRSRL
jgi:hypothetical protein